MPNTFTEGISPTGFKTFLLAEGSTPDRHLLYSLAAEDTVELIDTLGARPIGVSPDQAEDEQGLALALFGATQGTHLVKCGDAVAADDELVSDDSGRAVPLPTDPGTYWVFGRALRGGVEDGLTEFIPCFPREATVS